MRFVFCSQLIYIYLLQAQTSFQTQFGLPVPFSKRGYLAVDATQSWSPGALPLCSSLGPCCMPCCLPLFGILFCLLDIPFCWPVDGAFLSLRCFVEAWSPLTIWWLFFYCCCWGFIVYSLLLKQNKNSVPCLLSKSTSTLHVHMSRHTESDLPVTPAHFIGKPPVTQECFANAPVQEQNIYLVLLWGFCLAFSALLIAPTKAGLGDPHPEMYVHPVVDVAGLVAKWRLSRWLHGSGGQWVVSKSWDISGYYFSVLIDTCHKHLTFTLKHCLTLQCYQLCTPIFILLQCAAPHLSCACPSVGCSKWYPKNDLGLKNKWKRSKEPNYSPGTVSKLN